jgi:DNA-binding MltR family transcriptional regulator
MAPGIIGVDIRRRSTLMKSDWFDTALSNKGFMHSLLCTAALHMFVFGKGTVKTILYHRAKAISSVNKALSTQDRAVRFSDANLGAVFNLLTVEEGLMMPQFKDEIPYDEQPNAMMMHLSGLREMLHMRGGLKAVGTNRILQAFILWYVTPHFGNMAQSGLVYAY